MRDKREKMFVVTFLLDSSPQPTCLGLYFDQTVNTVSWTLNETDYVT